MHEGRVKCFALTFTSIIYLPRFPTARAASAQSVAVFSGTPSAGNFSSPDYRFDEPPKDVARSRQILARGEQSEAAYGTALANSGRKPLEPRPSGSHEGDRSRGANASVSLRYHPIDQMPYVAVPTFVVLAQRPGFWSNPVFGSSNLAITPAPRGCRS
jgi:hypothetical protein